jgi:hypothetical protein
VAYRISRSLSKASSKSYITKEILGQEEEEFNILAMLPNSIGIQPKFIGSYHDQGVVRRIKEK